MAKPKEKELSALELMIEHAENMRSSVVGMPRSRKASNQPDFSFNLNAHDLEDSEEEYYVGPGSRAKNRAARERREAAKARQIDVNVRTTQPTALASQPNPRQVESALEDLFIAGERSGDDIVTAIRDGNAVSQKTQDALEDWLKWEKSEAFKQKNKAKSDPHGQQPGAGGEGTGPNTGPANDDGGDDNFNDFDGGDERRRRRTGESRRRGRRYGRNSGNRRGPGRNLPRPKRFRGKFGAILGIAAAGAAALGGGLWLKNRANEEFEEDNAANEGAGAPEQPKQVEQQQPIRTADVNKAAETLPSEAPKAPSAAQDAAVAGTGMLLMGASKRIPIIGPALGNGLMYANDTQHIDADETLTEDEKAREKKKAAGSAIGGTAAGTGGAVAGAWIGGALGSVVPVVGTAAGAALGGLLGGILGDYFGSSIGEYVADKITDESDNMLAEGEKDRKEKMEEYNEAADENKDKSKFPQPLIMPFNIGGMGGGLPGSGAGTYQGPMRAQPSRRMDSKQVTDIAQKAIADGGLGSVSEQFESGGRGVGTVSTGQGDAGGVSYGKHQLATNNGSMMNFLNSPEGKPFLQRFGGLAPGTAQFNSVYKDVANTQGADLDKAQSDYITRTHYAPMVAKLQNDVGVDLSSRGSGVKEMIYSTAVQYGAGSSVVANALKGKDVNAMSDPELIQAVQDYKAATTDRYFKSSSAQTRQSVAMRAQSEKDVLLKVHEAEQKKKAVNTPKPVDAEAEHDARIAEKFPGLKKGTGPQHDGPVDENLKNLPDLTGRGPVRPKSSPEEYEKQLQERVALAAPDVNRIQPVAQPEAPIERQPLVTEGDVARQEAPPVTPVVAPAAQAPSGGAVSRPAASGGNNSANPSAGHSLDNIPVFLDDPMLNAITTGYM